MRAVFQAFPDLFFRLDAEGTILDYKAGSTADLYLPPEKLLGRRIQDIPLKEVEKKFNEAIQRLKETKSLISIEYSLSIEKREHFYEARLLPLLENQVIVIVRNITERKRAEERLRESEEKYRALFEASAEGILVADVETKEFRYANPAMCKMLGYTEDEFKRMSVVDIHPRDALEDVISEFEAQARGEKTLAPNIPCLRRDGTAIHANISTAKVLIDGRECNVGFFTDVTERRRAEEALRESEEKYRDLFENANDLIQSVDQNGRFVYVNKEWKQVMRYSDEEVKSLTFTDILRKDQISHYMELFKKIVAGETVDNVETVFVTKEGKEIFVSGGINRRIKDGKFVATRAIFRDITERKRAEEALRESEEKWRSLVKNAPNIIIIANRDGTIQFINRTAPGFSVEETIGTKIYDYMEPEYHNSVREAIEQVFRAGEPGSFEVKGAGRQGSAAWYQTQVSPIKQDDQVIAVTLITTDLTERKRAEENLKKAKEEAEEANRLKSEFLANMSHEIRTPMNAIIGMTGIALETDLTDEQSEYLSIVKESAYALLGLLDDILDLSKIEAGRVELETIDFDLRATVESVAETLAPRASTKGLELACLIHHEVPTFLRGDPGRLRQVLMNLGGNAVKFTEKGEVAIRVELEEETEDRATLLFSVTDTGLGVPKDEQEKIFESFTQVDGSISRRYGGTGLGLSISKRLVELLGGQIRVESQPGKGSRFWFTVAFEKQKDFKHISPPVSANIRGKRILAVDDNKTNRTILVKMLESFDCAPEAVESGDEAIRVLKRAARDDAPFDLVLLDLQMPEMDGEKTLRAIKDDPEIKQVVVIILTSIGERGDASRLEALGCAGYLLKPVKQSQLFDTIITVLSRQKTGPKEKLIPIVTRHTIVEEKRRRVRILLAEDSPMNQKLAVTLLKRAGYSVDAVENGRMAIEALKRTTYGIVFMDVQMPEMDGFEATQALRQMEGNRKHTPIVAMTAHAMKGDRQRCLQAGMDDYISKPIEPQEFFDAIEKWTDSSARVKTPQKRRKSKKSSQPKGVPLDLNTALTRLGDDKEFLEEMLHEFLDSAPKQLEKLDEAVKKGDAKFVEKEAHSLKGAAGNLNAKRIADLALKLELLGRTGDLAGTKEMIVNLRTELAYLQEYLSQKVKEKTVLKA